MNKRRRAADPWKWFFAYNGSYSVTYDVHIELMVRSAAARTSLDPHLIYFGALDNPVLPLVERYGVKVIHHEPSILPDLERIKAKFPDYPIEVATGAYLRIDAPGICRELGYSDEFVLYTDCDVVFQHDIPPASAHDYLRPDVFSCAPQRVQDDWANINTGVMIMNVDSLLQAYPSFRRFITEGDTLHDELYKHGPFDQKAYQVHYHSRWDHLPVEYNWKPYWGFNEDALVVHFHGPKIPEVRSLMEGRDSGMSYNTRFFYGTDPVAYARYLARFERFLSSPQGAGG